MAVIPPISAPLRLDDNPGTSGGISLGCHLGDDADASAGAAAAAAADETDVGDIDGVAAGVDAGADPEPAGTEGWRRWVHRAEPPQMEAAGPDSGGAAGSASRERFAGSILIVARGECTFEQKVKSHDRRPLCRCQCWRFQFCDNSSVLYCVDTGEVLVPRCCCGVYVLVMTL